MSEKYGPEDKECAHCKGNLSNHACGDRIIKWCDDCGSNSPENPPNIKVEIA